MNKKIAVSEESQVECGRSNSVSSPNARHKHAACLHKGCIYIHGGIDRNIPYKDFWRYHIDLSTWEKLKESSDVPPNLQSHTLTAYKDSIYVFGGNFWFDGSNETPLWIYELNSSSWRKPRINTEVRSPCSRRCHSAVLYDDSLYIYGGYIDLKGSSEEFWLLNLESEQWQFLKCEQSPGPRHSHTAVVHKDSMWLTGGMAGLKLRNDMWCWNFGTMNWMKVKQSGPDLVEHSAVSLGTHMLVYGGIRDGHAHHDLWLFCYETLIWQKVPHSTLPAVSHHTVLAIPPTDSPWIAAIECPAEHKLQTSKSENKIFRNKVLPCDTPDSGENGYKNDTYQMENVDVCRTKVAWVEMNEGACRGINLSLNLEHYAHKAFQYGITNCSVNLPSSNGIRSQSICQANSWESGLSESVPLFEETARKSKHESRGFVNTAYLNTSQSNSSLETIERERQHLYVSHSVKPQYLQHGVQTGNFCASKFDQAQVFSSRSQIELADNVTKANQPVTSVWQLDNECSSIVASDLVIENIENVSDTESSVAELLPASQNIALPTSLNLDSVPDKYGCDGVCQSITTENKDIVTLFILGGRQLRRKDFAEVKTMCMWKFQINL